MSPSLLHVLQGDVGRHPRGQSADRLGNSLRVAKIPSRKTKAFQQTVHADPRGHRIIIGQFEFLFLARQGQTFQNPDLPVHAGQSPAPVLDAARDDLERQTRLSSHMPSQQARIEVRTHGVDVVQE